MVTLAKIRSVAREIATRFNPDRITLFGSYAYGKPTADSDVDLLILMNVKRLRDQAVRIRTEIEIGFPVDIIVRTTQDYERRIVMGDFFLREISDKGKILYAAANQRVGKKGGRGFSNRPARGSRAKVAES